MEILKDKLVEFIINVVFVILSVVGTFIFTKLSKNTKNAKLMALYDRIPQLVIMAEQLFKDSAKSGPLKLDYVFKDLKLSALEQKIKIDDAQVIAKINEIVETTKHVNTDKQPEDTPSGLNSVTQSNEFCENTIENDNINI